MPRRGIFWIQTLGSVALKILDPWELKNPNTSLFSAVCMCHMELYLTFLLHDEKTVKLNMGEHKKCGEAENSFLGLMYGQYMLPGGIADVWAFQKLLGREANTPCETGFIQYLFHKAFCGKNKWIELCQKNVAKVKCRFVYLKSDTRVNAKIFYPGYKLFVLLAA